MLGRNESSLGRGDVNDAVLSNRFMPSLVASLPAADGTSFSRFMIVVRGAVIADGDTIRW
jgi:hypothetical protein